MASIRKHTAKSGKITYYAEIRLKRRGKVIHQETRTFSKRILAKRWAEKREAHIKVNGVPKQHARLTLAELADAYIGEYGDLVRLGRTKLMDIQRIAGYEIAQRETQDLQSGDYVEHIKWRLESCSPQTANNDLIWINTLLKFGMTVKNIEANLDQIEAAKVFLRGTGMIGRSKQRDRLPTPGEHTQLIDYFSTRRPGSSVPMLDILRFAMYSARRQGEITRILHSDNNRQALTGMVRDAKHPRSKEGNHQRFRYTPEAWEIVCCQPVSGDKIFPFNSRTVSAYFTSACRILEIPDLRFHDYRHLATTWLFASGYGIHEVAQFTLHESWDVLKRYTHLTPETETAVREIYGDDKKGY